MAESIDTAEQAAALADGELIRRVRWRLVAWSGGSTLIVLLVLGIALYLSVASSLQGAGLALLDDRAGDIVAEVNREGPGEEAGPVDFYFGGGGTFAVIIAPNGRTIGPGRFPLPDGVPDRDAAAMASRAADGRDVRLRTVTFQGFGGGAVDVPVRQLTVAARAGAAQYFVQVVQDRTAEVQTLQSLVLVLVLGGIVVVGVAGAFGAVYARRALVPIRDSLAGQRLALRRQREFAADASHELRTPLTVIRSSVELLRRNPERPIAEATDVLGDIDAEVQHLTGLVDDLLLLARSDSGAVALERVPLDLEDVAAEAATALAKPAADAGVRIEVDQAPTPLTGDPVRLRQLVTILLDNAIRHSPRDAVVGVVVRPDGPLATVAVDDAGPGVRPEDRGRIFDRFWRAPGAPPGGTGLGLAIARWIAEHHGGAIVVADSPFGGARFEVRLPSGPQLPPVGQETGA